LPHDAAGRNAGELALAAIRGRQRAAIGSGRAAGDAALMIAGFTSGVLPVPVVGHRAFDREHAAVVISYDQIEGSPSHHKAGATPSADTLAERPHGLNPSPEVATGRPFASL
jgi:hypothetical protein